jgi:hypothetical protein
MTFAAYRTGASAHEAVPCGATPWRPQTLWVISGSEMRTSDNVCYRTPYQISLVPLRFLRNRIGYHSTARTHENQPGTTISPAAVYCLDQAKQCENSLRGGTQKSEPGLRPARKDKQPHAA